MLLWFASRVKRLEMTRVPDAEKMLARTEVEVQEKRTLYALNPGDLGFSNTMGAPLHMMILREDARQLAKKILEMCDYPKQSSPTASRGSG